MNAAASAKPASTLDYARPSQPIPLDLEPYPTAVVCGAVPLAAGALVLLLWLIKAYGLFMIAAVLSLWGGVIMFCIGAPCFLFFFIRVCKQPPATRRHWRPRLFLAGALLLANAVACIAFTTSLVTILMDARGV